MLVEGPEYRVVQKGVKTNKCLWVGRDRDFYKYHGHVKSFRILKGERATKKDWTVYYCIRRARETFFAYKKREHERRTRYMRNLPNMKEKAGDCLEMNRCEMCAEQSRLMNLFWGYTLCNMCYFNPATIQFIMSVKFGDILATKEFEVVEAAKSLTALASASILPSASIPNIVMRKKMGEKEEQGTINLKRKKSVEEKQKLTMFKKSKGMNTDPQKIQVGLKKFYPKITHSAGGDDAIDDPKEEEEVLSAQALSPPEEQEGYSSPPLFLDADPSLLPFTPFTFRDDGEDDGEIPLLPDSFLPSFDDNDFEF
jgi:hypothetical protein